MRLLLLAPFSSINAEHDAELLRVRGWSVETYYGLHSPQYRLNANGVPTDAQARTNLVLELVDGTLAVIHPEAQHSLVQDVAGLCRFMRLPMVRMDDLPACPPVSQEVIDAHNCVMDPFGMGELHPAHAASLAQADAEERLERALDHAAAIRRASMTVVRTAAQPPSQLVRMVAALRRAVRWADMRMTGLKNPMVREQQQAAVRPYAEVKPPLSTTG